MDEIPLCKKYKPTYFNTVLENVFPMRNFDLQGKVQTLRKGQVRRATVRDLLPSRCLSLHSLPLRCNFYIEVSDNGNISRRIISLIISEVSCG